MGSLLGAFEIPLLPGVVIDIWRETTAPFRVWASTPVDGIGFSVLERVHLELSDVTTSSSNADSDLQTPVQAEIFGRHPSKGALLMERVKSEE